jgi:hypothetical protein
MALGVHRAHLRFDKRMCDSRAREVTLKARTTPDAAAVQTAIYRRMGASQRATLAAEMSEMARAMALENIRRRHPEYDTHQVRMALFRMLLGDDLFRRVWPQEQLLEP